MIDDCLNVWDGDRVVSLSVLGCRELEPLGCDSRWSCHVRGSDGDAVVVVSLWCGVVVDSSDIIPV